MNRMAVDCWMLAVLLGLLMGADGCSFKQWGRDFGGGLIDGVGEKSDTVAGKTAGAALDTLISPSTRAGLDTMIMQLGAALAKQAAASRDTLLGEYTRLWIERLKNDLLGASTKAELGAIRDELLGAKTRLLLGQLRSELVGDTALAEAGRLRDELLGPKTNAALRIIVDSAMTSFVQRYRQDLKPELEGQLGFIQRNASELLILIAGLATGIIAFVWYQKQKYARMLNMLTVQIHQTPDQRAYDELTKRIQRQAQERGLEAELRKVLASQGVLGVQGWSPTRQ